MERDGEEREALRQRILFQPHLYVGQERVPLATAPSWDGTSMQPKPVALRAYLIGAAALALFWVGLALLLGWKPLPW